MIARAVVVADGVIVGCEEMHALIDISRAVVVVDNVESTICAEIHPIIVQVACVIYNYAILKAVDVDAFAIVITHIVNDDPVLRVINSDENALLVVVVACVADYCTILESVNIQTIRLAVAYIADRRHIVDVGRPNARIPLVVVAYVVDHRHII